MSDEKVTAIILAGGKSSRMGSDKAFIKIKGKPIIERTIEMLKTLFDDIIIVANEPGKYRGLRAKVIKDIKPNCGPLSGIHSGLVNSGTQFNFVVACDMPFLNARIIKYMLQIASGYDAVAGRFNGRLEPLCAVYNKNLIPLLERRLISGNYILSDMLQRTNLRVITEAELRRLGWPERDFLNINDIKELGELEIWDCFC